MNELEKLRMCAKYPFLKEAKQALEEMKVDFANITDDYLDYSVRKINYLIEKDAAYIRDKLREINSSKEKYLETELISFPVSKILIALADDYYLKKRYARALEQQTYYFLQRDDYENPDQIERIAMQLFKMEKNGSDYLMKFNDYLNYLPEGYKLVNSSLSKGKVVIGKEFLMKAISKYAFENVMATKADARAVPEKFNAYSNELKKFKKLAMEDLGAVESDAFPPCIRQIISNLKQDKTVAHQPRFFLASFLANINMPVEKSVELFREQPNFDEKKTRYYLEHASGAKGGTKYTPPGCVKVESYGICFRDSTCLWKNPISYYKHSKKVRK